MSSAAIETLLKEWHDADHAEYAAKGYAIQPDPKTARPGAKYTKLDSGSSGAFMVENETGFIYCIKGYGVPDKKKCVGRLGEVTGAQLLKNRWWNLNYQKGAIA